MENYSIRLQSPVSDSFRCQKAAQFLDIDTTKKSIHELSIDADLDADYKIGLVLGASGSGKTTFAREIWGDRVDKKILAENLPIIDQFPKELSYDDCAMLLSGVGLTSVPCWIRPVYTLSNGQRARADVALRIAVMDSPIIIDEWTSVVDRTVAKVMCRCIEKFVTKFDKRVILLSCHYDVFEWLNPDWVIDCNKQDYSDRRLLRQSFKRTERLEFGIRQVDRKSWRYFSKYHYLSDKLPGGHIETFGLFHGENQVGFQCFANYVPWKDKHKTKEKMHSNRTVIHPDYAGLGMGVKLINKTSEIMTDRGYDVRAKFSSTPVYKAFLHHKDKWRLTHVERKMKKTFTSGNMLRGDKGGGSFREKIKTYSFVWTGNGTK